MTLDKFNVPFIDFINNNFDKDLHEFIFLQKPIYKYGMTKEYDVIWIDKKLKVIELEKKLYKSEKIIIHGLWDKPFLLLLFLQPWILKKCYHVMWGGDFYFPEKQIWIKKQVIKKIGHFVTYVRGDYESVQKWYGSKGKYHECFMYLSNIYKDYEIKINQNESINIQLGNSADPSNNHLEVLEELTKYKDENIKIFTPLSYGDQTHAKIVISKGKELFGDKFVPLTEFMPFEKYLEFLGEIDIAIFAHKRQQAMGNTITLLGLGKKVYMRNDINTWQFFKDISIKVFDVKNIEIDLIDEQIRKKNQEKIKEYFSRNNLRKQLERLFNE